MTRSPTLQPAQRGARHGALPGILTDTARGTLRRALATLVALVATAGVVGGTASPTAARPAPDRVATHQAADRYRAMDPEVYATKVLRAINDKRTARNLRPLRLDRCTDGLADTWGEYLADTGRFLHQSLTPFFRRCNATYAGETLAKGAVSPQRIVSLWMHSDGHRRIMLSRSPNRVGVGAFPDAHGTWVVAADFTRL